MGLLGECRSCHKSGLFITKGNCHMCNKPLCLNCMDNCHFCAETVCPECMKKVNLDQKIPSALKPGEFMDYDMEIKICSNECFIEHLKDENTFKEWFHFIIDREELHVPELYGSFMSETIPRADYFGNIVNMIDKKDWQINFETILNSYKSEPLAVGILDVFAGFDNNDILRVEGGLDLCEKDDLYQSKREIRRFVNEMIEKLPYNYHTTIDFISQRPNVAECLYMVKPFKDEPMAKGILSMYEGYKSLNYDQILGGLKQCRQEDMYHTDDKVRMFIDGLAEYFVKDLKRFDTPMEQRTKVVHVNANSLFDQIRNQGLAIPYKCPNCSGTLKVDGMSKMEECPNCGSPLDMGTLGELVRTLLG